MSHLALHNFRSYTLVDVELAPGVTAFVGRNGQGKTNLVEAIDYLSRLSSHRVSSDAPLVRAGAPQAIVRAAVVKDGRTAVLEVELNPGKSNKGRINKSTLPRARDLIGLVRTVVFSPEDLTLVKGDPGDRRRFLDDLLVLRTPRLAGTLADHDRILKQRATLLKTAGRPAAGRPTRTPPSRPSTCGTHTSPGSAPSCSPSAWRWSRGCDRTSGRRTRPSPAERPARTPGSTTSRSIPRSLATRPHPTAASSPRPCSPSWAGAERRARPRGLPGRPAP